MELISSSTDDPKFMRLMNGIISGLVSNDVPDEIFVIKIENWFDHKWLNFSGIGRVGFFHDWRPNGIDTALDEFWQDKITFPPFTPKRVIQEDCFRRERAVSICARTVRTFTGGSSHLAARIFISGWRILLIQRSLYGLAPTRRSIVEAA